MLLLPTWSIVHSRFWKAQIPYLARHCRVVTFDGRGNGRSDRPGGRRGLHRRRVRRRRARGDGRDRHRARGAGRRSRAGRCGATILAAEHPERVERHRLHRARRCRCARSHPERDGLRVRRAARHRRGLGQVQHATTGCGTTTTSSSSSSRKCFTEPHSTKQIEDCIGWALETTPETLADTTRGIGARRQRALARDVRARALPDARDPRRRRTWSARTRRARRWPRRPAAQLVTLEGAATCPNARDPVQGQPAAARVPRARRRRRPAGARAQLAAPARAVHLLADRARPRPARRRDRRRAAQARTPTSRSTGSPSTRSPRCSRRAASGSIRRAPSSPASRRTSSPSPPSTTCTASRRCGGWTRSWSRTSWSSTTSSRDEPYDLWIGDEAWELDYFLHENPELKTAALRVADRLRRLAADARRRRARGGPDRRLQRRDDRADRALPARARPRRSSSATPTTSCPDASGPACRAIREWTEQHFSFAGYITGFDPADARRPRRAARRARLPRPTSACASSPSAARASAATCCAA